MTSVFILAIQILSLLFVPTTRPADPATTAPTAVKDLPVVDEARRHLEKSTTDPKLAIWISESDPEILFIAVHLDKQRDLMAASGSDELTMTAIGKPSDLIFAGALRHGAWNDATTNVWVSYIADDGKRMVIGAKNEKGIPQPTVWRGSHAPAAPVSTRELKGVVRDYDVPSAALGETRKVTVYIPPGYGPEKDKTSKPAVIYFGDGGVVASMAHIVEPMITSKKIRPVVMVGAHTSDRVVRPPDLEKPDPMPTTTPTTSPDPFASDPRAMEYLTPEADEANADTTAVHQFMFNRHLDFFADELPKWAEEKLGVDSKRESRVISGFSNSAAFVVMLARHRPMEYGAVIANSVAGSSPPTDKRANAFDDLPKGDKPPVFWFSNGSWEKYFRTNTGAWHRFFNDHGAESHRMTVVGGHDQAIWELGVVAALPSILPPKSN